ncbi:capsular biosynthesis protein [Psychromonas sp. RZ22]|uniref:glycosyltransferase family 2 protein n=1 Tax=Psychromonas algarum TaxID=2555643 RepID=UPI00106756B5|nr:glycosyltransferase family 2 protein [Psychromonas sp. RZ22]TEW55754.1 capsular biosynthesis protein [Psychromonas sp. RZ22]
MIVIPMAGLSSRFFKAGYGQPKYMLEAHGETLFDHSVKSFNNYFDSVKFVFIVRDVFNAPDFVRNRVIDLDIKNYDIVVLDKETRGQAETVTLGLANYRNSDDAVTIFNIDTFRPGFSFPPLEDLGDGYLEVFRGEGDNWSFVRPIAEESTQINLTTEKNPISDLCCTGLYHFANIQDYFSAYDYYLSLPRQQWEKGELYVAPLYNYLIKNDKHIHYQEIPKADVIFCGTPDEYSEYL